uniref:Uncharacterized protein n=1 Tax=Biomphalaria glabrata TaxID=6526 RepID=A0A2C9KFD5_BIOGL
MPKLKTDKKENKAGTSSVGASNSKSLYSPVTLHSDQSIAIRILAKPGAKQNNITDLTADGVSVQISAPPVEGEANTELLKYISKVLGVKKSDLQLDKGSKSRNKVLLLSKDCGLSVQTVIDKLKGEIE